MSSQRETLESLRVKVETDPALRAQLLANPQVVFSRETGIDPAELKQQLSESELMEVTGGMAQDIPGETLYCPSCSYKTAFTDLMFFHKLFEHGQI